MAGRKATTVYFYQQGVTTMKNYLELWVAKHRTACATRNVVFGCYLAGYVCAVKHALVIACLLGIIYVVS